MNRSADILPFPPRGPAQHSPAAVVLAGLLILTRAGVCVLAGVGLLRLLGY